MDNQTEQASKKFFEGNKKVVVFVIITIILIFIWQYNLKQDCLQEISYGPVSLESKYRAGGGVNENDHVTNLYKHGMSTYKTHGEAMDVCISYKREKQIEYIFGE